MALMRKRDKAAEGRKDFIEHPIGSGDALTRDVSANLVEVVERAGVEGRIRSRGTFAQFFVAAL